MEKIIEINKMQYVIKKDKNGIERISPKRNWFF